ncbi:protein FAM3C isoform X2 [Esox lucius]|uniref:protein FAM3C isoform X2 n=1 Tax=Esox lucius TaxID=8010 RepID=UPI0009731D33|nr:protein FAM3C isoform X2 [Esox lucius]
MRPRGVQEARLFSTALPKTSTLKCDLSKNCPIDHFAFHISSGAADVVGPKICFDGKIVMSGVRNNVGKGLNLVFVNGETGKIEDFNSFDMYSGKSQDILDFLKTIKPGMIVLVASFDDSATQMTDEIRDIFVGLGSSMIKDVKFRDSWVFAGAAGIEEKSTFEKRSANDEKTNVYGKWPEMVDIAGCFPRKI